MRSKLLVSLEEIAAATTCKIQRISTNDIDSMWSNYFPSLSSFSISSFTVNENNTGWLLLLYIYGEGDRWIDIYIYNEISCRSYAPILMKEGKKEKRADVDLLLFYY